MTEPDYISTLTDTELKVLIYDVAIDMQKAQQLVKLAQIELSKRQGGPDAHAALLSLRGKMEAAKAVKEATPV